MYKIIKILLLMVLINPVLAQSPKFTISGTVKDKKNGETMIGSIVSIKENADIAVETNEYGFYSLSVDSGSCTLVVQNEGYEKIEHPIMLQKNVTYDVAMEEENLTELENVVMTEEKDDHNVKDAQVGSMKLDVKEISKIPVFLGEKDIIKTLQLTPGVKSGGDGSAGMYVRGGAGDQNLILLDEAPVYNASHLLGFFSTFNSDALKDVTIYKGGMPAQYGGRLSSVLDIKMKEGNNQKYNVSGGLGMISSRLNVEGPIKKDKGSFLIAGRRSYADLFLKLSPTFKDTKLFFYDLNLKANYQINSKNRVYLSGYFGQDKLGISTFGINWGNATGTLRWNSIINSKLFSNTSFILSNYNYKISINNSTGDIDIKSKIRDYNFKQEFSYSPNNKHFVRFGVNAIHHTLTPGQITSSNASQVFVQLQERYSWENAAYVSDEWKTSGRLRVNYGLRLVNFSAMGGGNFYTYDNKGKVIDTRYYSGDKVVKNYLNLEPRLSASYTLSSTNSLKVGYARNVQNLHLISNSVSTSPTDLWISSSKNVKPEVSDQVSIGYFQNFKNNEYEFSAETYYKDMQNQIDYRDGANTTANDKIEGELLFGKGRAYGLEVMLKKKSGRFNGWIGYTLSRTEKQIDGINNNEWYAARQDRTHDISVVGIFDLSKKWSISGAWVYYTGNAVTFPTGKYTVDGTTRYLYTERNGYRMPAYHRLDIGATWYRKKTEKFESSWNFSLYNAYGRQNAYTISFRQNEDNPNVTEAVQTALFRFIPSITYNFKF